MIHFCFLQEDERDIDGARLWRIHIDTRWFHLGIALTPNSTFGDADGSGRWFDWHRKDRR